MGLLTGKTAFVSGGTRGIGLAIAERLAREGADVMVSGSSQSNCDAAVKRIASNSGGRVEACAADLRTHEGAQWEIQKVAEGCLQIASELWPEAVGAYRNHRGV